MTAPAWRAAAWRLRVGRDTLLTAMTFALAATWIGVGVSKATDFAAFRAIVARHGLWPNEWSNALVVVPVIEVTLGLSMVALARRRAAARATHVAAIMLLATFSLYLLKVPAAALAEVGCGCGGLLKRALANAEQQRRVGIALNAALALGSGFVAWRAPIPLRSPDDHPHPAAASGVS